MLEINKEQMKLDLEFYKVTSELDKNTTKRLREKIDEAETEREVAKLEYLLLKHKEAAKRIIEQREGVEDLLKHGIEKIQVWSE